MIFNRFVREARTSVEAAIEEARMLGHDSIGDEDLLLGILRADEGVAAEALSSLGVTLEDAREESLRMTSEALSSVGISLEDVREQAGNAFDLRIPAERRIPFSPRAKRVLEQSLREARRLGDNRITPEHILRGTLSVDDGTSVRMLARLGVSPAMLGDRLLELRGRAAS